MPRYMGENESWTRSTARVEPTKRAPRHRRRRGWLPGEREEPFRISRRSGIGEAFGLRCFVDDADPVPVRQLSTEPAGNAKDADGDHRHDKGGDRGITL